MVGKRTDQKLFTRSVMHILRYIVLGSDRPYRADGNSLLFSTILTTIPVKISDTKQES